MYKTQLILLAAGLAVSVTSVGAEDAVEDRLAAYRAAGATGFSIERGRTLWTEARGQAGPGRAASCADCHTRDLARTGSHVRTGRSIEPLAPAVNAARLTDPAKIEKWLLRNCKGTWGRECSPQEKGDLLVFIRGFGQAEVTP